MRYKYRYRFFDNFQLRLLTGVLVFLMKLRNFLPRRPILSAFRTRARKQFQIFHISSYQFFLSRYEIERDRKTKAEHETNLRFTGLNTRNIFAHVYIICRTIPSRSIERVFVIKVTFRYFGTVTVSVYF